MPTSSLPQVYVLHPVEWGTSLLLRAGYSPAHWDKVCICRAGKKKGSQQKNNSRIQLRETPAVIWTWGWGRVKERLKKKLSIECLLSDNVVWNTTLCFHVCRDCWSSPEPAVWHSWECADLQTASTCIVIFCSCLINVSSIPFSWLPKIPNFIHISLLACKRSMRVTCF